MCGFNIFSQTYIRVFHGGETSLSMQAESEVGYCALFAISAPFVATVPKICGCLASLISIRQVEQLSSKKQ